MKRFIALLATAALFITPIANAATKVKIGFVNSITGPEAPIGENLTNGVTLAIQDLKKQGIDVDLIKEDDTGKPEKSMAAFEKLATRDGVVPPAYGDAFRERLPGARLEMIPHAAHALLDEQPERVAAVTLDFVGAAMLASSRESGRAAL